MNIGDNVAKKLDDYPDIMTIEHVMSYLIVSKPTVYNLLTSGKLKGYKMGRIWRISKENLIDYCKQVGLFS